jgi:hypothetical protein
VTDTDNLLIFALEAARPGQLDKVLESPKQRHTPRRADRRIVRIGLESLTLFLGQISLGRPGQVYGGDARRPACVSRSSWGCEPIRQRRMSFANKRRSPLPDNQAPIKYRRRYENHRHTYR